MIHDRGGEFTGIEFHELLHSYGVKSIPTAVKKPRANSIVEIIHLTIGDILRTVEFKINGGNSWSDEIGIILQHVPFALRTSVSTSTGHSLAQMVYNRDMIL